jgi:hypothetical protein
MYKQHEETVDSLTSGCPILAKNEYLMRHSKGGALLRYSMCKTPDIETTKKKVNKPECEHEDVAVLWNQRVHTNRKVAASMPVIIIKNKEKKTCILIDVAIPGDRNFTQKEAEKLS